MLKDKEKLTVLLDIFGKSMVTQLEEKVKKNYSTNFLAYAAEIGDIILLKRRKY